MTVFYNNIVFIFGRIGRVGSIADADVVVDRYDSDVLVLDLILYLNSCFAPNHQ